MPFVPDRFVEHDQPGTEWDDVPPAFNSPVGSHDRLIGPSLNAKENLAWKKELEERQRRKDAQEPFGFCVARAEPLL